MEPSKFLILITLQTFIHISDAYLNCSCTKQCLCSTIQSSCDIQCPYDEPQIAIKIKDETASVTCISEINWDSQNLPQLDIRFLKHVEFNRCPLPLESEGFFLLLQKLGISSTKSLKFTSGNSKNSTLTANYFIGLENIEKLDLSENNIRQLHKNVFKNLTELKQLNLRGNRLNITSDLFQHCSKLTLLDLAQNELTHLPVGVFKSLVNLQVLYLWSNKLEKLNKTVFQDLKNLYLLEISFNRLETLPENTFDGLSNLKRLSLVKNKLKTLPEQMFKDNLNLEEFKLNMNPNLTRLPRRLFSNLTKLKFISLSDCNVAALHSDIFEGANNIENITLFHNNISYVSDKVFKDMQKLKDLDLSYNQIEYLPGNLFSNCSNLISLKMEGNLLTNITKGLFSNLEQLETINLKGNKMNTISFDTFQHAENLKTVVLSYNNFKLHTGDLYFNTSPFNFNKNLEVLDLSHNNITIISQDWMNVMVNLRILDLSYNKLSYVDFPSLIAISSQLTVDLSHNLISTINFSSAEEYVRQGGGPTDIYFFQPPTEHTLVVYINNNPLICDCNIYDFTRYVEKSIDPLVLTLLQVKSNKLVCSGPTNFIGLSVDQIKPKMLTCSLNQLDNKATCPNACDCGFRPWDKSLIIDCENRNLSSAPKLIPPKKLLYNQTHVYLQQNNLIEAPNEQMGYENVTRLMLSFNNIGEILWIPPNLKDLELHNNNLSRISHKLLLGINTSSLRNISLGNNPWICDCQALNFSNFLIKHLSSIELDAGNIKCKTLGKPLIQLNKYELCPTYIELITILCVTFAVAALLVAIFTVCYYRYESEIKVWLFSHNMCLWFVTEEEIDKNKTYDAFVSYSHKDEEFVMNKLLPVLEQGSHPYKLCLHVRDWIAGEFIPKQIARSVEESRRTLVVLSPSFLQSVWGKMEFRTAHTQAMSEGRARVIIILYGEVDLNNDLDGELKAYIKTNTYVKWGDPWFWNKLRYALPHSQERKKFQQKQNIMITLNEKFDLINVLPSAPSSETTPPAINVDPLLLKTNPLNFTHSVDSLKPPAECGLNPLLLTKHE